MSLTGRAGLVCVGVGVAAIVLVLSTFPTLLVGGCTDVGVPDDHDGQPAIRGVDDGAVVFTPEGVNECRAPIAYLSVPPALVAVGGVLVAADLLG